MFQNSGSAAPSPVSARYRHGCSFKRQFCGNDLVVFSQLPKDLDVSLATLAVLNWYQNASLVFASVYRDPEGHICIYLQGGI